MTCIDCKAAPRLSWWRRLVEAAFIGIPKPCKCSDTQGGDWYINKSDVDWEVSDPAAVDAYKVWADALPPQHSHWPVYDKPPHLTDFLMPKPACYGCDGCKPHSVSCLCEPCLQAKQDQQDDKPPHLTDFMVPNPEAYGEAKSTHFTKPPHLTDTAAPLLVTPIRLKRKVKAGCDCAWCEEHR